MIGKLCVLLVRVLLFLDGSAGRLLERLILYSDIFTVNITEHVNNENHFPLNCPNKVVLLYPRLNPISASRQ